MGSRGASFGNVGIVSVSLRNTLVNQASLTALLYGSSRFEWPIGIGELDGITEMDLSGIDFGNITDLEPIYAMDDLTDLWLVDTVELDVTNLDVLLDNLETIERADTEGVLYTTQADFDAFNTAGGGLLAAWDAEPGHHVEFVPEPLLGDMSLDGEVDGRDVDAFVVAVLSESFPRRADMNGDDVVNGLDVDPFVAAVVGSGAQSIPEPSTLLLALVTLGVIGGWRKWSG